MERHREPRVAVLAGRVGVRARGVPGSGAAQPAAAAKVNDDAPLDGLLLGTCVAVLCVVCLASLALLAWVIWSPQQ